MLERASLISFDRDSYTASVRFADSLASVVAAVRWDPDGCVIRVAYRYLCG